MLKGDGRGRGLIFFTSSLLGGGREREFRVGLIHFYLN
jgi:hypothetical protein